MAEIAHSGEWTIEDRCESAWHYLPFDVPSGTQALRVEFDYDSSDAVLDLGCFGPAGFRGWSGSARRFFVITAGSATPGYVPGPIEPGRWQVAIGLHLIPARGVSYRLAVQFASRVGELTPEAREDEVPPLADRPPRRGLPSDDGMTWLAGDLHTHTVHSDGVMTVPELARFAVGRGLDFLAVTDHNTVSHHAELPAAAAAQGIILVPGQELTTDRGHANAFGYLPWVDFREPPDDWLAATELGGGLLSVNHPYGGQVSWATPMRRRPPLIEIWHWSWLDLRWTAPLSWWLAWHPGAIAVGGSDWHRPGSDAPPGSPTTWVQCTVAALDGQAAGQAAGQPTRQTAGQAAGQPAGPDGMRAGPTAVLDGLAAGRVAISASRDGPVLLRVDGELVAVGADGAVLAGPDGPRARVRGDLARFADGPGYHRLVDPTGATLALTG